MVKGLADGGHKLEFSIVQKVFVSLWDSPSRAAQRGQVGEIRDSLPGVNVGFSLAVRLGCGCCVSGASLCQETFPAALRGLSSLPFPEIDQSVYLPTYHLSIYTSTYLPTL